MMDFIKNLSDHDFAMLLGFVAFFCVGLSCVIFAIIECWQNKPSVRLTKNTDLASLTESFQSYGKQLQEVDYVS